MTAKAKKLDTKYPQNHNYLLIGELALASEMSERDNPDMAGTTHEPESEEWWRAVGEFVRLWRRRITLTQEVLSDLAAVNRETIIRLERGEAIKLTTLRDITYALLGKDVHASKTRGILETRFLEPAGIEIDLPGHTADVQPEVDKAGVGTVKSETPLITTPEESDAGLVASSPLGVLEHQALIDSCWESLKALDHIRKAADDAYVHMLTLLDKYKGGGAERETTVARHDRPRDVPGDAGQHHPNANPRGRKRGR